MQNEEPTFSVRIGFLPTYRFSYGDWCRKMHVENLAVLRRTPGCAVVELPVSKDNTVDPQGAVPNGSVHSLNEAEAAVAAFRREGVDGLVICPLDFGDERAACKTAELLGVPVLLYATREPPARTDDSLGRVSDSYCGTLSIAAGLRRRKIPFHFAGHFMPEDPGLAQAFSTFVQAVSVVKGMRNARLGQIGVRPPSFETVAYDERALNRAFGQNVICCNTDDIVTAAKAIPDDDLSLRATTASLRSSVAHSTVSDDYFSIAARVECAIADFYRRERLSAMAMQCWPSIGRSLGIEVCAVFGHLTQSGMLTACETDILGALSMLIQHRAAIGRTLPHFIDWTIRHRQDENKFLAWHCGNAPPCLARERTQIAIRTRSDMAGRCKGQGRGGLYQFELREGPVTICRIAEYDGHFKLFITNGVIVPSGETLAGTWAWVAVRDHEKLYNTLIEEGFIHHASMVHGDYRDALMQACCFLGIRPVLVS